MSLHVPSSWPRMTHYAKMCYLVNSNQARDFKEARQKIAVHEPKPAPPQTPPPPVEMRLPYKDD